MILTVRYTCERLSLAHRHWTGNESSTPFCLFFKPKKDLVLVLWVFFLIFLLWVLIYHKTEFYFFSPNEIWTAKMTLTAVNCGDCVAILLTLLLEESISCLSFFFITRIALSLNFISFFCCPCYCNDSFMTPAKKIGHFPNSANNFVAYSKIILTFHEETWPFDLSIATWIIFTQVFSF